MLILYRNSSGATFNLTGFQILGVARVDQKPVQAVDGKSVPLAMPPRYGIQAVLPGVGPVVMELFVHEQSAWAEVKRVTDRIVDASRAADAVLTITAGENADPASGPRGLIRGTN